MQQISFEDLLNQVLLEQGIDKYGRAYDRYINDSISNRYTPITLSKPDAREGKETITNLPIESHQTFSDW